MQDANETGLEFYGTTKKIVFSEDADNSVKEKADNEKIEPSGIYNGQIKGEKNDRLNIDNLAINGNGHEKEHRPRFSTIPK